MKAPLDTPRTGADGVKPLIQVSALHKWYGGVHALKGVAAEFAPGQVHALVGENGAGKSTLGKVISGVVSPSAGELLVDGSPVRFAGPRDAVELGIAIVHQELSLLPSRSVAENVFVGLESSTAGIYRAAEENERLSELTRQWGFELDPRAKVGSLATGDQQKVEILRALARDARLVVMDEPTARLTRTEAEQFYEIVRRLTEEGKAIVLVSHFLNEVLALSDTVTTMRDGAVVRTSAAAEETSDSLVQAMLGRSLDLTFPVREAPPEHSTPVLEVRDLSGPKFRGVSFSISRGQILGIAGMVGSGRTELLRTIFGAERPQSGSVLINGEQVAIANPTDAIKTRIAMLPESRKDEGLFLGRPVGENIVMSHLGKVARQGMLSRARERRLVAQSIERFAIKCGGGGAGVDTLSGGNQQKVAFAKWLVDNPEVLLLDEPTRGVDVGAKHSFYELISGLATQGSTIVVVSSELEEVLGLADMVAVMRRGEMTTPRPRAEVDEGWILTEAFGADAGRGIAA